MKKYIYLFALSILLGWFAFADDGWYNINSYRVNMDLHTDASMDVSENIDVNFLLPRHGIYRQIPIIDPVGDYLQIDNIDSDQPIASEGISKWYYELKLWSADKTITWPQPYNITYTVKNAIKAYAGSGSQTWRSELYRNILGDKRSTSISWFSFMISIPSWHIFASGDIGIVYGYKGDRLTDDAKIYQSWNYIYGIIDRALSPSMWATIWLKFPVDYFQVSSGYNNMFFDKPMYGEDSVPMYIYLIVWFSFVLWIILFMKILTNTSSLDKTPRKSDKSVTIYYKPPTNISPSKAFWFWYDSQNPKVFTGLLYYRCTRWRAKISKVQWEKWRFGVRARDTYHITETSTRPTGTDFVDDVLLQWFFWTYDDIKNDVTIDENFYDSINWLLSKLEYTFNIDNIYYTKKVNIFSLFWWWKAELTEEGKKLFEELRWYKEYLMKVDKPVLESELKADPDFFNKTLPWAVLFGVSTKLLEAAEDILAKADWYDSYDNRPLTPVVFNSMNNNIKTFAIAPRSDSSGSGFGSSSGGSFWWSSWGWGGGWGWGSW